MASHKVKVLESGLEKFRSTSAETFDFVSVKVGASLLEIKETTGHFDFSGKNLTNVALVDGRDVSVDGAALDAHLNGGANKHDATEVDYERVDGSKVDIQAASDDVESAITDLDNNKISKTGVVAFTGNQSFGGFKATNLADPTAAQDAVTKVWAESRLGGLDKKHSVKAATAAALAANTASGAGVGKTLTANANGALSVDGVSTWVDVDNDAGGTDPFATSGTKASRVLVKDEVTGANNGLYNIKDKGSAGTPFKLIRATDADQDIEVTASLVVFIEEGTVNADSGWSLATNNPIVVDTTSLSFTQFTGTGAISAGAGILKTGSVLDVELDTAAAATGAGSGGGSSGLEFDAGGVAGKLRAAVSATGALERASDGLKSRVSSTGGLEIASNNLQIKSDVTTADTIGVTTTANGAGVKFNATSFADGGSETLALAAAVAGAGISLTAGVLDVELDTVPGLEFDAGGAAGKLRAKVDNVSIERVAGGLQIKDLGVSTAKIADDAVDKAKLNVNVIGGDLVSGLKQETDGQLSLQSAKNLTNDNAGSITIRQVVYIKSTGAVDLAKADASATAIRALGIVQDASIATTVAGMIIVRKGAVVSGFSGLTPGAKQYLSPTTAGALTETAPSTVGHFYRPVAEAISATEIVFESEDAVEIAS